MSSNPLTEPPVVPYPEWIPRRYNSQEQCDMWIGPCLCGSTHNGLDHIKALAENLTPRPVAKDWFQQIAIEHAKWVHENFPYAPSWQPLLGLQEELGELSHAFLKRAQGIRGAKAEHDAKIKDAVGDIVIFLLDFCGKEGISIEQAIKDAWAEVSKRDWNAHREQLILPLPAPKPAGGA